MSNETTIRANVKVSGLSQLEKANSLIKQIDQSLANLGRGGGSNTFSGLTSGISKTKVEVKELEAALKRVNNIRLSNIGNSSAEGLSKAENKANQLKATLEKANNVRLNKAGTTASEGLSKAENQANQLKSKLEQANNVNLSKAGNSAVEGLNKAEAKASQLRSKLESINGVNGSMVGSSIANGLTRAEGKANQFQSSVKRSVAAERELASAAQQVAAAEQRSSNAARQGAQARQQAVTAAKQEGKIRGAIKDVAGMYTIGNLAANGIMAAGEGVKNLAGAGLSYISNQQASQVSWASNARSVNKLLGRNISNAEANKFSKGMVRDVQNLATSAGNDYRQVSDAALAFYATGAGVSTAGNKKKTLQLTKDMLNLQDAGGLNDEEMGRFISSVAKTLDQDKLTTMRLQQLKQFNPNIDEYLDKAYKKRTGHKAEKTSDYSGDDLVKALHMMGMAPGVSDASKKMNQSLAGVQRAIKNGAVRMTAGFEERLGKGLNKAFGGDGKLFSRITGWFNDPKKTEGFTNKVADGTSGVISTVGSGAREAVDLAKKLSTVAKPFAGGFSSGFIDQVKSFKNGLSEAYRGVKGTIGNISDMIPKGAKSRFSDIGKGLGTATGKVTAFLAAIRGLSKLPGIGQGIAKAFQPLLRLSSKVPLFGKGLSSLLSKITGIKKTDEIKTMGAASKMQGAANTMMSAANRMNGGRGSGGVGGASGIGGSYYGGDYYGGSGSSGVKLSRMALYHGGSSSTAKDPWFTRLSSRGAQILGQAGSRSSMNRGIVQTVKGKTLSGLGAIGTKIFGESKIGNAVYRGTTKAFSAVRRTGSFIKSNGALGMNALFAGMDALSVMGSTKAGSLARHKGIGGAIGNGVGGALGMAAGSLLGPMGSVLGGMAGSWIGNKAGSWIGSLFGGSKSTKKGPSWSQRQQTKAAAIVDKTNFTQGYNSLYGKNAPMSASKAYSTLKAANRKGASAKTIANAQLAQQALDSGDTATATRLLGKVQKGVRSDDVRSIKRAQTGLSKAKKSQSKAYNKAYRRGLGEAYRNGQYGKSAKDFAKSYAKGDKNYKKASRRVKSESKKLSNAKKNYKKDTGKSYKASRSKKKGSGSSKKASRNNKSASKSQKDAARKLNKAADKTNKASKKASKKSSSRKRSGSSKRSSSKKASVKAKTKGTKGVKKLSKATKKVKNKNAKVKAKTSGGNKVKKLAKATKKVKNKNAKVKAKTSGGKKVKKLSKDLKKVKNKKAKVKVKTSGQNKVKKLSKDLKKVKNKKAKVKVRTSGQNKVKKLSKDLKKVKNKNARVRVRTSGGNKAKKLARDIKKVKNKNARVRVSASGSGKVKSLANSIKRVKNKTARVRVSASGSGKVKSLANSINRVKNKTAQVTASVSGTGKVKALTSAINTVKGKKVSVSASVSGTGAVRALASAINSLHDKVVHVSVQKSGKLATGTPGAASAFRRLATGTPAFMGRLAKGTPAATTNQWSANGGVKKGSYLVNDAPGADFVEAFMTKAGTIGLFPKQRNILVPLEEGTQVLNAKDTKRKFPRLKTGTPSFNLKNEKSSNSSKNDNSTKVENHNTFNINVNVDGSGGIDQKLINQIANQIAEKLTIAFPETEV